MTAAKSPNNANRTLEYLRGLKSSLDSPYQVAKEKRLIRWLEESSYRRPSLPAASATLVPGAVERDVLLN